MQSEKSNNQIFNVGSGEATSVISVAEKLKDLYQSNINIKVIHKFRLGDIRHNYADISKINLALDVANKISLFLMTATPAS